MCSRRGSRGSERESGSPGVTQLGNGAGLTPFFFLFLYVTRALGTPKSSGGDPDRKFHDYNIICDHLSGSHLASNVLQHQHKRCVVTVNQHEALSVPGRDMDQSARILTPVWFTFCASQPVGGILPPPDQKMAVVIAQCISSLYQSPM